MVRGHVGVSLDAGAGALTRHGDQLMLAIRVVPAGVVRATFRVRAVYADGAVGNARRSRTATTAAATGIPSAPLNPRATAAGSTSVIDLDWDAPASDRRESRSPSYRGCRVRRTAVARVGVRRRTTGLTSFRHAGSLPAGTTRHYRVRARNASGFGPWTSAVHATTCGGNATPGPPRALTATADRFASAIELRLAGAALSAGSSAGHRATGSSGRARTLAYV